MILIDHSVYSFAFQIENGICLLPWKGDPNDCELMHLTKYLIKMSHQTDVRKEIKKRFGFDEIQN